MVEASYGVMLPQGWAASRGLLTGVLFHGGAVGRYEQDGLDGGHAAVLGEFDFAVKALGGFREDFDDDDWIE